MIHNQTKVNSFSFKLNQICFVADLDTQLLPYAKSRMFLTLTHLNEMHNEFFQLNSKLRSSLLREKKT